MHFMHQDFYFNTFWLWLESTENPEAVLAVKLSIVLGKCIHKLQVYQIVLHINRAN